MSAVTVLVLHETDRTHFGGICNSIDFIPNHFSPAPMSSSQQASAPAWRREAPRDDSPDGRSEISLEGTPTPAWKRKPRAWLNRTNVLTALVVFVLSVFFLVAALWPTRRAVNKGTFYLFSLQIHWEGALRGLIVNLTYMHRSQRDGIKSAVLPRAQIPTRHDPLWPLHGPADERAQWHEELQSNGGSDAVHGLPGYLGTGRTEV